MAKQKDTPSPEENMDTKQSTGNDETNRPTPQGAEEKLAAPQEAAFEPPLNRYYYWSDEDGTPSMTPSDCGKNRNQVYFKGNQTSRDPFESQEERLKGAPVDAVNRYYYWDDGVTVPAMRPNRPYFGQGGHRRHHSATEIVRRDELEARRSVPIHYDYRASNYNSEYDGVSDAYAAYLEGTHAKSGDELLETLLDKVAPRGGDLPSSIRAFQDTFYFSEEVIEKIAAHAVYNIDGVLALSGSISENLFKKFNCQTAAARVEDDGVVIDLRVVLAYGVNGKEIFRLMKENISTQIFSMTGLTVDAVHIEVVDIMTREEFNAHYESQAPEIQQQQIEEQRRRSEGEDA